MAELDLRHRIEGIEQHGVVDRNLGLCRGREGECQERGEQGEGEAAWSMAVS